MSAREAAGGRSGGRAERRRRQRQQRRRLLAGLLGLAVLAAVVTTVLLRTGSDPAPPGTAVPPQQRTQTTLLMQVQGEDGTAVATALLAHDPVGATGAAVLVPPQVIVDVPGAGSVPLGRALTTGSPNASRNAVADLLGVTVDADWTLDLPALARVVDELGGLQVTVDVPVVQDGAVVVSTGEQRLDGGRTTAFLRFLAPGEQEQARLARLQEVVDGLLAALPDTAGQVQERLAGLAEGSRTSLPPERLAEQLVALAQVSAAGELQYDTLPVIPIDAGGGVLAFRLDVEATGSLVDRLLAQSVPSGERDSGNRVLVLNGVGTPGLGESVRSRLVEQGFVFVGSRNADRFGVERTVVLVPESTPEAQLLGERVAAALGVTADVRADELGSIADVIVVIGSDFAP